MSIKDYIAQNPLRTSDVEETQTFLLASRGDASMKTPKFNIWDTDYYDVSEPLTFFPALKGNLAIEFKGEIS